MTDNPPMKLENPGKLILAAYKGDGIYLTLLFRQACVQCLNSTYGSKILMMVLDAVMLGCSIRH